MLLITQTRNDLYRKEQLNLPYYFLVSLLQIYPPVQKTNSLKVCSVRLLLIYRGEL